MTSKTGQRDGELSAITTVLCCASIVQLGLVTWNLLTGDVHPVLLIGGSLTLFVASVVNYAAHVRKTYRTCLESRGKEAATPYQLEDYQNGLLGVRRPRAGSFFARAAWRAGRDVAASEAK